MGKNIVSSFSEKKKNWMVSIKHEISEIDFYLKKIESLPFNLKINKNGPNKEPYYENNMTFDIHYHLNKIKVIFREAKKREMLNKKRRD